jgi:hypothetical protein
MYLTAILGFVVISHQRDKTNSELEQKAYNIARTFIPSVRSIFDRDTVYWYVDADDKTGELVGQDEDVPGRLIVSDIGLGDSVTVDGLSYTRNDTLRFDSTMTVSGMESIGEPADRIVVVPVGCRVRRTGIYRFAFRIRAHRIHSQSNGVFRYRDITFRRNLIPDSVLSKLDIAYDTLTAIVTDTSMAPRAGDQLVCSASKTVVNTARGFDEEVEFTTNLGWGHPQFRIVRGGGTLETPRYDVRQGYCTWRGHARFSTDTVVVEAMISRAAGGKDHARTAFVINAVRPLLVESLPTKFFAGEDASFNIKVRGLDNDGSYRWTANTSAGTGSTVTFRVPLDYAGRSIRAAAFYNGRPFQYEDPLRQVTGTSEFVIPVVAPPTRIQFNPPDRPSWRTIFTFMVSRYFDPKYERSQMVDDPSAISVTARRNTGEVVRTQLEHIGKGVFSFQFENADNVQGAALTVVIAANETRITRTLRFRYD